ncbi:MAG TPA: hypothetical protein VFW57_05625 [Acidimicrobiia bacterium]|nr:hypothetical protein [Acidimicrobiia bacterium]
MHLNPEIARWLVAAEQERLTELARKSRPRPGTVRRHRRRRHSGDEGT